MPTRRRLHRTLDTLDRELDRLVRPSATATAVISPYRGFGRGHELLVRGRVLLERNITRATGAEPLWRNVVNTWRRFSSAELAGVKVRADYRDAVVETLTDEEGYFQVRLEPKELGEHTLWHEVGLQLPDRGGATAVAHVMLPSEAAQFAVISDIDDTVVVTNATSLLGMARSVLRNAAGRLPFEGVADLYRALHRDANPIFYVSSSPWNMYDLLHDFMQLNGIPHGPMFLQDWGIDESTFLIASHETHKLKQIDSILEYYPDLRFVLIGDSGQHDPEIYLQVIRAHRERILAAFIRDVTPDLRDQAVARILEESNAAGVEMLYVRDSSEALGHARRIGLV